MSCRFLFPYSFIKILQRFVGFLLVAVCYFICENLRRFFKNIETGGKRIGVKHLSAIVVDDEPYIIKSFLRLCRDIPSIQIASAFYDYDSALMYVKSHPYDIDIAFLDIDLPGTKGDVLARQINETNPTIDVIYITAWEPERINASLKSKAVIISKPFSKKQIEDAVHIVQSRRMTIAD